MVVSVIVRRSVNDALTGSPPLLTSSQEIVNGVPEVRPEEGDVPRFATERTGPRTIPKSSPERFTPLEVVTAIPPDDGLVCT